MHFHILALVGFVQWVLLLQHEQKFHGWSNVNKRLPPRSELTASSTQTRYRTFFFQKKTTRHFKSKTEWPDLEREALATQFWITVIISCEKSGTEHVELSILLLACAIFTPTVRQTQRPVNDKQNCWTS